MNAARTAAATKTATLRALNERLVVVMNERKALNRVRGPLGHGVIVHANKAEKMAAMDREIEGLRAEIADLRAR